MHERIAKSGRLDLASDASEVEALLLRLETILKESCLDEMSVFHLNCAVVELVNNCIQHAYQNEQGHRIEISYRLETDCVHMSVFDQGAAFHGAVEQPRSNVIDESGRGLEIVRALVSEVRFEHKDGWNICHLVKRLA